MSQKASQSLPCRTVNEDALCSSVPLSALRDALSE
jgi:hypothetical protein